MKVLTLASILLLPGALLAGVAGMNINFNPQAFVHSALFWIVVTAIILIALATLGSPGCGDGSDPSLTGRRGTR